LEVDLGRDVFLRNDRARIEDVLQQIVETRSICACDVRPDFAADGEQSMTLLAGLRKQCSAQRQIRSGAGREERALHRRDGFDALFWRRLYDTPNFADLLVYVFVVEIAKLAHNLGGDVGRWDRFRTDGVKERPGITGARRQDYDRIAFFGGWEVG